MIERFEISGIGVDVVFKNIKNIHLSVNPPHGAVRIAAPERMKLDTIRVFAISKLAWIRQQQRKLQAQERETPREFLERESHYVWGKRYLLHVVEADRASFVELKHRKLVLHARPGASLEARQALIDAWYRGLVREAARPMIEKWQPILRVTVNRVFVQRMKTKWGSCASRSGNIRLNTDLAKKPVDCLEYIIVHELAHLLEPTHNARFISVMDAAMPDWKIQHDLLNGLPVRQEMWKY